MDVQSEAKGRLISSGPPGVAIRNAKSFAHDLVNAMAKVDPRAVRLDINARGKNAVLGLQDGGERMPLLRLSSPSASYNVMSLDVRQGSRWATTLERGTPEALAKILTGDLMFTWATWVQDLEWSETSEHGH